MSVKGLNAPRKKDSKARELFGVALQDRKGVPQEMFGPIQLRADNSGWARWERVARQAKYFLGTRPSLKGESFFGEPVLRTANNGKAGWVKDTGNTEGLNQKSTSGYLANLHG